MMSSGGGGHFTVVFIMGLFLLIVVLIFLSIDTQYWKREYEEVKKQSRGPMAELQYDAMDIFSGGALSLAEVFRNRNE